MRRERALRLALIGVGVVALAYDGPLMAKYTGALATKEPSNVAWTPAVYQLSRDLQIRPGRIFTVDWGITNPLFTLHPSGRFTELSFELQSATLVTLEALGKQLAVFPGPKLFVTHSDEKLAFPKVNVNLFKAVGRHLRLATTIAGHDGKPVFEIYTYR